jgi:hypothetical protein
MVILISILLLLTILTEAVSEALFDNGKKTASKAVQVGMFASYFAFAYECQFGWHWSFIALWLMWRGLTFNTTYNFTRKPMLPYNFFGTTSLIDRFFLFITQGNLWMWLTFQAICAGFLYAITFGKL